MSKQIVLFIVEGFSDKNSFENILNHASVDKVKYKIVGGDITIKSGPYNIVKNIRKKVNEFLYDPKNKYFLKDIKKIVHLIDIDGVFLDSNLIEENKDIKHITYVNNKCLVKDKEQILERNKNKSLVIKKLSQTDTIDFKSIIIPYEAYYFSCNLEHVFHDNPNVVTEKEKIELSNKLADKYFGYENLFIKDLENSDYATKLNYKDSWNNIIDASLRLEKSTNFNLFFKQKDD